MVYWFGVQVYMQIKIFDQKELFAVFLIETNADLYSADMNMTIICRNELGIPEHNTLFFQKGSHYSAVKPYLPRYDC